MAWSRFNSSLIVSGACSAFRREILLAIGGFSTTSWAEDYEIMYRLHSYKRQQQQLCQVMLHPDLCVQTDAPATIYSLLRQRRRWAGGFLETMLLYRHLVGDRRYGILGWGYLLHNALSIVHPFYGIGWLVGGFALSFHGRQTDVELLGLLLLSLVLVGILVVVLLGLYRSYFRRRQVSPLGAVVELLLRPLFYLHLIAFSHIWGYFSCLRRRKSW